MNLGNVFGIVLIIATISVQADMNLNADEPLRGGGNWIASSNGNLTTIGSSNQISLKFNAGALSRMFINSSNGYVGIATDNPSAPLEILSNTDDKGLVVGRSGKSTKVLLHVSHSNYGYLNLGGDTQLRGNGQMSTFEGQVGIGTANPGSYKLAVEGKIGAREIVVTASNWADHVFNEDYNLKSLSEVEKFIKKNKCLEGIPSAKSVEENGVSVGKMQVMLLEKIEELTLHMIELKKENEELKSRMENIE